MADYSQYLDFYKNGDYDDFLKWAEDNGYEVDNGNLQFEGLLYGLNPAHWFDGSLFNGGDPVSQHKLELYNKYLNSISIDEFFDLYNSGASSKDLIAYLMQHKDFSDNNNEFLNSLIGTRQTNESYGDQMKYLLQAAKENGVNPLNIYGNIGNTGSYDTIDLSPAQSSTDEGSSSSGLSKLLMFLLGLLLLQERN